MAGMTFTGDHGGDDASTYGVPYPSPSKPVVRATHMKTIRAKKAKLDQALAVAAAAREEFEESIRDAFAAGLVMGPVAEAAGLSKDRVKQIKHHRRT